MTGWLLFKLLRCCFLHRPRCPPESAPSCEPFSISSCSTQSAAAPPHAHLRWTASAASSNSRIATQRSLQAAVGQSHLLRTCTCTCADLTLSLSLVSGFPGFSAPEGLAQTRPPGFSLKQQLGPVECARAFGCIWRWIPDVRCRAGFLRSRQLQLEGREGGWSSRSLWFKKKPSPGFFQKCFSDVFPSLEQLDRTQESWEP